MFRKIVCLTEKTVQMALNKIPEKLFRISFKTHGDPKKSCRKNPKQFQDFGGEVSNLPTCSCQLGSMWAQLGTKITTSAEFDTWVVGEERPWNLPEVRGSQNAGFGGIFWCETKKWSPKNYGSIDDFPFFLGPIGLTLPNFSNPNEITYLEICMDACRE